MPITDNNSVAHVIKLGYNNRLMVSGYIKFNNIVSAVDDGKKLIAQIPVINVDLSGMTNCDSSVLSMLLIWQKYAMIINKRISFYGASQQLLDLINVYGLTAILEFKKED